jgi:glycosyltransferase involved in cell wall biosynthesis
VEDRRPKVSVILPTYKGEDYIRESMDSILNQTFEDFELVIVYQEGSDSTLDIVGAYEDPRIRVVTTHPGYPHCNNAGLDNAKGEYVAIQDDDDVSVLDRLEKQVRYLDEHPDVVAVTSTSILIDADGNKESIVRYKRDDTRISGFEYLYYVDYFIPHSSFMFRNTEARYDETVRKATDMKFELEMFYGKKTYQFPEPLVYTRRGVHSIMLEMSIDERFDIVKEIKRDIKERYNLPTTWYIKALSNDRFHRAGELWENGFKLKSVRNILIALLINPLNWRVYRGVFKRMVKGQEGEFVVEGNDG